MTVLIIAEHDQKILRSATLSTVTAAKAFDHNIDLLIVGEHCQAVVKQASIISGITRILVADAAEYAHQMAENVALLIADLGNQYSHILAPATTFGKNLMPRVSALMDVAMIGDVIKIISSDTFVRPIYAGNALETVQTSDLVKVLTIRSTAFVPAMSSEHSEDNVIPIEVVDKIIPNNLSTFDSAELHVSKRPELTSARVIVAGGRGLQSQDNFKLLEALADRLGGAVGASRAAVDAGFAPNDYQIGQTGKVVAPELYIAIGISGAIQHLAGMKDSKVIVAINNDPDAPIFQIADYGLVADLFTTLKELEKELLCD